MADELEPIAVEVAYATPTRQRIVALSVPGGTTMLEAVLASGIFEQFPEIDAESAPMGIFGKRIQRPRERVLSEGERVEIYRPLAIDPKEARKRRAARKRSGQGQA